MSIIGLKSRCVLAVGAIFVLRKMHSVFHFQWITRRQIKLVTLLRPDDETEHRGYFPTVPGLCEVLGPTGRLRYRQISYGADFGIKSALTQKSSPRGWYPRKTFYLFRYPSRISPRGLSFYKARRRRPTRRATHTVSMVELYRVSFLKPDSNGRVNVSGFLNMWLFIVSPISKVEQIDKLPNWGRFEYI